MKKFVVYQLVGNNKLKKIASFDKEEDANDVVNELTLEGVDVKVEEEVEDDDALFSAAEKEAEIVKEVIDGDAIVVETPKVDVVVRKPTTSRTIVEETTIVRRHNVPNNDDDFRRVVRRDSDESVAPLVIAGAILVAGAIIYAANKNKY